MSKSTASVNVIKNATASIRSTKPDAPRTTKKTATAKATEQVTQPVDELEDNNDRAFFDYAALFEGFKIPSGRRMLTSVVLNFVTVGLTMYCGFSLTGMLLIAAALLTSSSFLAFMISFTGMALSIYAGVILGAKVGKYIALGQIDEDSKRARAWIGDKWSSFKNKFNSNEEFSHV